MGCLRRLRIGRRGPRSRVFLLPKRDRGQHHVDLGCGGAIDYALDSRGKLIGLKPLYRGGRLAVGILPP